MDKGIVTANSSSIYDILAHLTQNAALFLSKIDSGTWGVTIYSAISIITASLYIFHKQKVIKKRINPMKEVSEKECRKVPVHESDLQRLDYHKVLNEFHAACNNCSNIFSSMKCVQLSSNYPELINIKLSSDGVTPFHRVCFHGNEPLIEFMLAKGADPEMKTVAGENALCMALYYYLYTEAKDFNCLNTLYKNGCYLRRNDEWYDIFLNLAVKSHNENLTKWILTYSKPTTYLNFERASSVPMQ